MASRSDDLKIEVAQTQLDRFFSGGFPGAKGLHFAIDLFAKSQIPEHVSKFNQAIFLGALEHISMGRRISSLIDNLSRSGTEHGLEALRIVFADHNLFSNVVSTIRRNVFFNLIGSNSPDAPHTINVGCKNGLLDFFDAETTFECLEKLIDKTHPETDDAFCNAIERGAIEFLSDEQIKALKKKIRSLDKDRKEKLLSPFVESKSANGQHVKTGQAKPAGKNAGQELVRAIEK